MRKDVTYYHEFSLTHWYLSSRNEFTPADGGSFVQKTTLSLTEKTINLDRLAERLVARFSPERIVDKAVRKLINGSSRTIHDALEKSEKELIIREAGRLLGGDDHETEIVDSIIEVLQKSGALVEQRSDEMSRRMEQALKKHGFERAD